MAMIDSSIQYLKGVGPAFAKKFEKLGVTTIRDLLLCYPRKYIDYTKPYTVVSAPYDVDSCVRATVLQKEPVRRIKGGRALVRVLAADDSGVLGLSWFNTPYVADKLIIGQTMTIEDGSSLSQSQTHLKVFENLVESDAKLLANTINNQLIPRMISHGFPLQGYHFAWDDSPSYTPEQQMEYEKMISDRYVVDGKYFADKYNMPVGERIQQPSLFGSEPADPKDNKKDLKNFFD